MTTQQPRWRLLANLGDVHPVEYGGFFVYKDTTGVYTAEAEVLLAPDTDDSPEGWTVYRFPLDRCTWNATTGVLSDNPYHPDMPAWFAKPEGERANRPQDSTYLSNVARTAGQELDDLRAQLCSDDPIKRAQAYRDIAEYHGYENFDHYPRQYAKRSQLPRRMRRFGERRSK
jgi:hypothetical protein